jgi:multiple sugar transport system substrate-binding protein
MSLFQIVLVSVFGAIAVAAVLIFALAVGGNDKSSIGEVQVWGTLNAAAFNAILRQQAEANPNFAHIIYTQKEEATFIADVTNALASGTGPDLIVLRQDYAYSQAAKLIPIPATSLSSTQFKNTFVDAASPFIGDNGVLAVPFAVDPLVLYWNKDLLATKGYAKPPQYWDELNDMARRITVRSDSGSLSKSAIDFGEYDNVPNAKSILSLLIMQAGGQVTTKSTEGKLVPAILPKASGAVQSTLSALRFYTEFSDPSKDDYTWSKGFADAQQSFAVGDLALYIGHASEAPLISRMNPNLNYAIAPVPQIRGAAAAIDTAYVYGFAVPRAAKNPAGALTVAALLSGPAVAQPLSIALGMPSARRDVLSQPAQGNDDLFNKQAIISRNWTDPDPVQTEDIFRAMIEDTVSGAALITEAVQHADQQLAHILGL